MRGLELHDLLRTFVAVESNEDAIPVLGDEDAMKVLAAWRKTDQQWRAPKSKMPVVTASNHAAVWRWIVSGWTIDEASVAKGAGLSPRIVHEKLDVLVASRLIYPDGQISQAAHTAIKLHIANKLGIKAKRSKEPKEGAKRDRDDNNN